MAKIKHFFREEEVYEECSDRGLKYDIWVSQNVEHYCCSECGAEVNKSSIYCFKCGAKFSGIEESYKTTNCYVCGTKFKQLNHKDANCCSRCETLIKNSRYDKEDLAKAFYELGRK